MKNLISVFILTLFFLISCSDSHPDGILERDEMVSILIRLHIAEAKTGNSYLIYDTLRIYFRSLEDSIFKKYNTNDSLFDISFKYYMQNPAVMEKIYSEVVDSLSLKEAIKQVD